MKDKVPPNKTTQHREPEEHAPDEAIEAIASSILERHIEAFRELVK